MANRKHCISGKKHWGMRLGRLILSAFFVGVGTLHFSRPGRFVQIMPELLPYKRELVYISGAFEILGGLGLLCSKSRKFAGKGLIALLLAVFPANLNMALNKIDFGFVPQWVLWARVPLQFLLIYIIHRVSKEPKCD
jgi:uncharacterized membrane protein